MSKIAVLGAGAWGTALAKLLAEKGGSVVVWAHEPDVAESIRLGHENTRYFPGFQLPTNLTSTSSAEEALQGADMVLLVVPSHVTREVLGQVGRWLPAGAPVVSATKGIENDTLCLMHEVFAEVMGPSELSRYVALSGPSFAKEVALRHPTVVVIGGRDAAVVERVQLAFFSEGVFRAYGSEDLTGVEMGGALKNVIAIAAGAADGLGFGHNTRAALITRGLAEIAKLAAAKGANPLTMAGLAGMGDLVLTCTGELSRNRTIGLALGRGQRLEDAIRELGHVAEGVKTAESARDLANKLGVEAPIVAQTYAVLYEQKAARDAMTELMVRPARRELDF
ncbi:MAG: NAD(P)-dependent glycerol-3-phosphate dehydrogenase [Polyangiaceae bacterium]|nr:NAD(P)-dependent glycerol-3-phosphate dehydrogenase [Polyangiaceae bacterium]